MNIQYFIWPTILLLILASWLIIGYKINIKNPKKGFWFLCVYMLFSTHFCVATSEDISVTPRAEVNTFEKFQKAHMSQTFEYHLVKSNGEQFIRVRPFSSNTSLYLLYNIYRNFLLNSWIPEYVFDLEGNLIDWTTDNHDDGWYQDRWDHSKEIKELGKEEVTTIFNKPT